MAKELLQSLGYEVTTTTYGFEAIELIKADPDKFDIVITDMTMPQMTGDELASKLIKVKPNIPIILCTGFSEQITEEKAKRIGIRAFLLKPVVKRDMAETIRKVLDDKYGAKDRNKPH